MTSRKRCEAHWYVFESPNGPTSKGVCKRCGHEVEQRNWIETSDWMGRAASRRRAGDAMAAKATGRPRSEWVTHKRREKP